MFFTVHEALDVNVKQETGGDRIVLDIWSDEASLDITMQGGVAMALWRFLARAARREGEGRRAGRSRTPDSSPDSDQEGTR